MHQLKYINGGHGAAIQEDNWELIANFIINGRKALKEENLLETKKKNFKNKRNLIVVILGFLRHFIIATLSCIIIFIAAKIITPPPQLLLQFSLLKLEWIRTAIFIAYLSILWQFLTRI